MRSVRFTEAAGNKFPKEIEEVISEISGNGGTPLVVCVDRKVTGVIELQDNYKTGQFRNVLNVCARWEVKTVNGQSGDILQLPKVH